MAVLNENKLNQHIQKGNFATLYLFIGEESYSKRKCLENLVDTALGNDINEFNYSKFRGDETELYQVLELAIQFPMMSERRVIVVDDFALDTISDSDFELLQSTAATLPDTTLLIFVQDVAKISKRDKGKRVQKFFEESGIVANFEKLTGKALVAPLVDYAKQKGSELSDPVAEYLIDEVGNDYTFLVNELDKLISFAGQKPISKQNIDSLCIKTPETRIYYLMDFLQKGNFSKAYETYNILVYNKTEPEYILGVIASSILDLYRYKAAFESGYTANDAKRMLEYKGKDYPFQLLMGRVRKYSMVKIRQMLDIVSQADMKIKTARDDANLILEILLVQLYNYMR